MLTVGREVSFDLSTRVTVPAAKRTTRWILAMAFARSRALVSIAPQECIVSSSSRCTWLLN